MASCGVDRHADSVLRDLILVVEPEPDADLDEVDRLVRQLRADVKNLDIESVTSLSTEETPPSAKGIDPVTVSALLVTLAASGGVFTALIESVRDWLARHAAAERISVTIDGDTLVLEKSSGQERSALIDAYIRRHEVT